MLSTSWSQSPGLFDALSSTSGYCAHYVTFPRLGLPREANHNALRNAFSLLQEHSPSTSLPLPRGTDTPSQ